MAMDDTAPASLSRQEAKSHGFRFYIGSVCKKGHSGRRYVSCNSCIDCGLGLPPGEYAKTLSARKQAKALGDKFYLSSTLCPLGHIGQRYTSNGACRLCFEEPEARSAAVVRAAAWAATQDPDRLRAMAASGKRARRARDPEKARAVDKRNRDREDKAARAATTKRSNAKHIVRYRKNQRDCKKKWRDENPEAARLKGRLARARRRALELSVGGSYTVADIERMMVEQDGLCNGCQKPLAKGYHVDPRHSVDSRRIE